MNKGLNIARLRATLALHACAYGNLKTLAQLLADFWQRTQSIDCVFDLQARWCAKRYKLVPDFDAGDAALDWREQPQHHILTINDENYPSLLKEIDDAPPVLFVRGDPSALIHGQVAIVGSRKATVSGVEICYEIARDLGNLGYNVTSGLAYGIDAAAHRGALSSSAQTIAVLGCGADRNYPLAHRKLADAVADQGAVVSEFPLEAAPRAQHFPRRNRIISGLALGTVVIEAAIASGSLITAMTALEQGRCVFAVPGSIRNPLSQGCHRLIKQGASLVTSVDDILQEIAPSSLFMYHQTPDRDALAEKMANETVPSLSSQEACLLGHCDFEPISIDVLIERTGLTASEVSSMLSALEMKGAIRVCAGGTIAKA